MHIHADSFLQHMNNERNILCFKDTPDYRNVEERDEGEIVVYLTVSEDKHNIAVEKAVEILQKLHDNYWEAHGIKSELFLPVTYCNNQYLYVDTERRRVGFKSNIYTVTLPFTGVKGFAEEITRIVGKCIEICHNKTLNETIEVKENKEEHRASYEIPNVTENHSKDFERLFKEQMKAKMMEQQKVEPKKPVVSMTVSKIEKYKVRRFHTTEDLVLFLNKHNINKSNIIDIQHKWFSHVLIYTYEKEVII